MIFNFKLTLIDILQHIEELQQNNMPDDDAWEMYYEMYSDTTPEMRQKADVYVQKYEVYPLYINYELEGYII